MLFTHLYLLVFFSPASPHQRSQSNDRDVVLSDLRRSSAGLYTCEASSEAPRFKTINGQGRLRIIDRPDSRPIIDTGRHHRGRGYRVGEILDANCTSLNSDPPADLKWYINNELVSRRGDDGDYDTKLATLLSRAAC